MDDPSHRESARSEGKGNPTWVEWCVVALIAVFAIGMLVYLVLAINTFPNLPKGLLGHMSRS